MYLQLQILRLRCRDVTWQKIEQPQMRAGGTLLSVSRSQYHREFDGDYHECTSQDSQVHDALRDVRVHGY